MGTLSLYNVIFFNSLEHAIIAANADFTNNTIISGAPYTKVDSTSYEGYLGINSGGTASFPVNPSALINSNNNLLWNTLPYKTSNYTSDTSGGFIGPGYFDNLSGNIARFRGGVSDLHIFTFNINNTNGLFLLYAFPPYTPCFLKGTKILCQIENEDKEVPIEEIKEGMLVKTYEQGYKAAHSIRKTILNNPGHSKRIVNRLYKCSKTNYPELTDDLYITGGHGIMLDRYTNDQAKDVKQKDSLYMLRTFKDSRAEPFTDEGSYDIYNIALENKNKKMNYSIWVNGLLVESIAIKDIASMQ
jgi:hypothetical protein